MGDLDGPNKDGDYSWEKKHKRSWDVFEGDETVSLQRLVTSVQMQMRRMNGETEAISTHRAVIRYMILVLDLSENMASTDGNLNRCSVMFPLVEEFISEFFDHNPLSHLGIVVMRDGLAFQLSKLCCNFAGCIGALRKRGATEVKGNASLQNALELSNILLSNTTLNGSKEILVIYGSLSTHDPGNILETVDKLKRNKVSVGIIGASAEVHICSVICNETKGAYNIILNEDHFKDLLSTYIPPKYLSSADKAKLIEMGFPSIKRHAVATLCMCHRKPVKMGYLCPRCHCFVCNISTVCPVCKLILISNPLLARSYYHLFPASQFEDVSQKYANKSCICSGCQKSIPEHLEDDKEYTNMDQNGDATRSSIKLTKYLIPDKSVNMCKSCSSIYCSICDIFIHKRLHNCPGCMLKSES